MMAADWCRQCNAALSVGQCWVCFDALSLFGSHCERRVIDF